MSKNVLFFTYFLESLSGYSKSIHCNYIHKIELNSFNPYIEILKFVFNNVDDFKFLNSNENETTGFTANKIYALLQLVDCSEDDDINIVKPKPDKWKLFDITNQIVGYYENKLLTPEDLVNTVFEIPLNKYNTSDFVDYDLSYLNYPFSGEDEKTNLSFGEEVYFLGNVTADIKADVYVLDLPINLLLGEFNSSTNPTWNIERDDYVAISEVGIYADINGKKELVAIGKFNSPIKKNNTISRSIVFAIDF